MDLGTAKLGTLLSVDLVAEWLRGLHRVGTIPRVFPTTGGGVDATVTLTTLDFEMSAGAAAPFTRLRLGGTVELEGSTLALPLDTWVRLETEVRPGVNPLLDAVVLGFRYDGVDTPPAPPLSSATIDALFTSGAAAVLLANLTLPLFQPLVDAAGAVFFPDAVDPPPPASLWAAAVTLMPGAAPGPADPVGTIDALGLFIDLPGGDARLAETSSILPTLTEFGIVYSRAFLDTRFAAANQVGEVINGATITEFMMEMGEAEIRVEGAAVKDIARITFAGPITAELVRGSTVFLLDAGGIDVDVDLPWWADLLFFLTGEGGFLTLGLGPIFGGIAIEAVKGQSREDILAEVDAAPAQVRGSITGNLTTGMSGLAQALSTLGSVGALRAAATPESSRIADGTIAVFAQVFVNPISADLGAGTFSRRANRLVELQLTNTRWFTTSELARIVNLGLITVPGYQAVSPHMRGGRPVRGYMQDSPDLSTADNLRNRFGT